VTERIVPQHLVLVLPTTGEFDSRSWRIARTCIERGHAVTILARWKDGLPFAEESPLGFRIQRIRASAEDAMAANRITSAVRLAGRRAAAVASRAPRIRRILAELQRRTAILLTIRAHRANAFRDAPSGDLYHGMAFMGIPVALDLGRRDRRPVVYDARDIYLNARNLARMGRLARWLLGRLERGWARSSSRVVTVNDAYADVMASRWPVQRPIVVMNCSFRYTPPAPPERRFHDLFGLDQAQRVVLYHGGFSPWRGIEQLIEAIQLVDGATLVLMGYGILEPTLRAHEADPATRDRVRVAPAVPPDELHDWVASADVAAMPIQGDTVNHRLTTPNKLFEAMAAGVPAVVSDLPGMRAIVNETGCGILVDPADPRAIAGAIRRIIELPEAEWLAWRRRCLDAAHDRYNWETQVAGLLAEYGTLTGQPW
jgi:glycosyltransferase involved in cell wall biosynthesis